MNGRTLINLYWLPGSRNPADLSSKTHNNLAKVVNGSYYRHGHASYANIFPCEQSILFATMMAGTYKFRGLSSLANHPSHCYYCCSKYGREVAGILVFHTELLGTGNPTTTHHTRDGYDAILTDANDVGEVASLAKGSDGVMYSRQFYEEILDRFSSLDKLIVGLVTITLRLRKVPAGAVEFNSVKTQIWDRIVRS